MSIADPPVSNGNGAPFGQIYDRGYQHYEGERLGQRHAIYALTKYSAKRALGIRKNWTAKVMPVIVYIATALIIIIPLGIIAFFEDADPLQYWDYIGFVYLILVLFVASTAPELICSDRREKVLPLYFSRSMRRSGYVFSKLLATALLTLTVSLLPMLIYWLGRQLLADDPLQAMQDGMDDLWRIFVLAMLVAFYLGSLGVAIASTTKRSAIAVGGVVVGLFLIGAVASGLASTIGSDPWQRILVFFSPLNTIENFSLALWDQPNIDETWGEMWAAPVYAAVMILVVVVSTLFTLWRYRSYD